MTLTELKAQAARVFVEECARYEIQHAIGTSLYCVVGAGEFLPRFPSKPDARSFITRRGLEARDRWLAENAGNRDGELWKECGTESWGSDPILDGLEAFAALGRGEG